MTKDSSPNEMLSLPAKYARRIKNSNFEDTKYDEKVVLYQPEAYAFSDYMMKSDERLILVDIGCGSGQKVPISRTYKVLACDSNSRSLKAFKRRHLDAQCVEINFDREELKFPNDFDFSKALIVCADVVEHLINPEILLAQFKKFAEKGAVIIITTPDRNRLPDGHQGPPNNPAHVQEWNLNELVNLAHKWQLPVAFKGHTFSDNILQEKNTSIVVIDKRIENQSCTPLSQDSCNLRPLGVIAAYNDADIIEQVCEWHLKQGLDLHLIDNWSEDETYAIMLELRGRYGDRVTIEQFPEGGPEKEYKWAEILDRKAHVGTRFPGRWIIHIDSDEIRTSPWPNVSLADALEAVRANGYNCVNFCVVNFLPTKNGFARKHNPIEFFTHFEFGRHPAHFIQYRAWIQPTKAPVNLSSSGGHQVQFEGLKTFPYRFGLLHYSIRSHDHGKRKVFEDRMKRYSRRERREKGWHNHYDAVDVNRRFLWLPELLLPFHFESFFDEFILEIISDAVRRRSSGSLI